MRVEESKPLQTCAFLNRINTVGYIFLYNMLAARFRIARFVSRSFTKLTSFLICKWLLSYLIFFHIAQYTIHGVEWRYGCKYLKVM
jgi:hypothetical protein